MLARCLASLLTFSCLALKSSSACCCTRKYASEFCRDFLSPSASCRNTADWCLSACSWDWRSRSDSGSEFEELVPAVLASNSNTTSTQDCGVFSLSTRSFYHLSWRPTGFSRYIQVTVARVSRNSPPQSLSEPALWYFLCIRNIHGSLCLLALHYFLYHCIVGCSSPIFCLHTTRETSRHITCLACSIRNSFW